MQQHVFFAQKDSIFLRIDVILVPSTQLRFIYASNARMNPVTLDTRFFQERLLLAPLPLRFLLFFFFPLHTSHPPPTTQRQQRNVGRQRTRSTQEHHPFPPASSSAPGTRTRRLLLLYATTSFTWTTSTATHIIRLAHSRAVAIIMCQLLTHSTNAFFFSFTFFCFISFLMEWISKLLCGETGDSEGVQGQHLQTIHRRTLGRARKG